MKILSKTKVKFILNELFRDLSATGSVFTQLILIFSLLFINIKTIHLAYLLFINIVLSTIICYSIRLFYFKERPNKKEHTNLLEKLDASSFPSTHTSRSFAASIIIAQSIGILEISIILYLIAINIAISRVYLKYHHKIDVIFGTIIGIITALFILFFF